MQKLIWMSDPHYSLKDNVLGHDPGIRIKAAVDHVKTYHADAELCVITGDMVNHGVQNDYEGLRDQLQQLDIPYFPIMGNHDNRALLRSTLPLPNTCMADFIQYTISAGQAEIICLDTHKAGSSAGEFCEQRFQWLEDLLASISGSAAYLFMHHPPMPLGLPMQDADRMNEGEQFIDLISQFDCVRYLFLGHVHRPVSGSVKGLPFSTLRSVLLQAPPPRPEWNWKSFKPAAEAPDLGIVTMTHDGVTIQYEQFCTFETGTLPA